MNGLVHLTVITHVRHWIYQEFKWGVCSPRIGLRKG